MTEKLGVNEKEPAFGHGHQQRQQTVLHSAAIMCICLSNSSYSMLGFYKRKPKFPDSNIKELIWNSFAMSVHSTV